MTAQLLSALSAVIGGLAVGALEELRARRRAIAADESHRQRQLEVLALDRRARGAGHTGASAL